MADSTQLARLVDVVYRLRRECPWDSEQTHRSLAKHLIEETAEVIEAIEEEPIDDAHLKEELGDVLLQVFFHAEIASQEGRFTIEDVAKEVADKLIHRHPYIFGDAETPEDVFGSWEKNKLRDKHRESCLDGIPSQLDTLAKAYKYASRTRNIHDDAELADEPITAEEVGKEIFILVQRAQASGVDPDQALRDELRKFESQVRQTEKQNSKPVQG